MEHRKFRFYTKRSELYDNLHKQEEHLNNSLQTSSPKPLKDNSNIPSNTKSQINKNGQEAYKQENQGTSGSDNQKTNKKGDRPLKLLETLAEKAGITFDDKYDLPQSAALEKSQSPAQVQAPQTVPLQITPEHLQQLQQQYQLQQAFANGGTAIVKQEFGNQQQTQQTTMNDLKTQLENQQMQQMQVLEGAPQSPHQSPSTNNMAAQQQAAQQQTQINTMSQLQAIPAGQIPAEWGHQRVQLLQNPIQNPTYLQQLYPQVLMGGNILQGGLGQQQIQVITAGKPFQSGQLAPQMLTTTAQGKSVLSNAAGSFSGSYIPTIPSSQSQTLLFSPVSVLSSQPQQQQQQPQTILSAAMNNQNNKTQQQDVKTLTTQKILQKVAANGTSGAQTVNAGTGSPQQNQCVQVSQAMPTAQIINPIQQPGTQQMQFTAPWQIQGMPQFWATNGLQSQAVLAPNPIFIRGTQPDGTQGMFIHNPQPATQSIQAQSHNQALALPQTIPQTAVAAKPRGNETLAPKQQPKGTPILPQGGGPPAIRPASSVSTQTAQNQNMMQYNKGRGRTKTHTVRPVGANIKTDSPNQSKVSQQQQQQAPTQQPQQQQTLHQVVTSAGNKMVVMSGPPIMGGTMTQQQVAQISGDKQQTAQQQQQQQNQAQQLHIQNQIKNAQHQQHQQQQQAIMQQQQMMQQQYQFAQLQMQHQAQPQISAQTGTSQSYLTQQQQQQQAQTQLIQQQQQHQQQSLIPQIMIQQNPQSIQNTTGTIKTQLIGQQQAIQAGSPLDQRQLVPVASMAATGTTQQIVIPSGATMSQVHQINGLTTAQQNLVNQQQLMQPPQNPLMSMANLTTMTGSSGSIKEEDKNNIQQQSLSSQTSTQLTSSLSNEQNSSQITMSNSAVVSSSTISTTLAPSTIGKVENSISIHPASTTQTNEIQNDTSRELDVNKKLDDSNKMDTSEITSTPNKNNNLNNSNNNLNTSEQNTNNRNSKSEDALDKKEIKGVTSSSSPSSSSSNINTLSTSSCDKSNNNSNTSNNNSSNINNSSENSDNNSTVKDADKKDTSENYISSVTETSKAVSENSNISTTNSANNVYSTVTTSSNSTITTTNINTTSNNNNNNVLNKNDKGLPKAMVKPQVLTHVIEGFVIQEANEAFPVTRQRYPDRDSSDEPPSKKKPTENDLSSQNTQQQQPANTVPCENCGKYELQSKLKKKRFCSMSCVKASKTSQSTDSSTSTSTNDSIPLSNLVEQAQAAAIASKPENISTSEKNDDILSGTLNGRSSPTLMVGGEEAPLIVKWTVADVCEFIKNLPGCSDYADDFAIQEIDGQALLLLKENHLVNAMGMKLGPALKIVAKVDSMRIGCGEKETQNQ